MKDVGAGNPDGGLFRTDQIPETRAPLFKDEGDVPIPDRGAIEVKPPTDGLDYSRPADRILSGAHVELSRSGDSTYRRGVLIIERRPETGVSPRGAYVRTAAGNW